MKILCYKISFGRWRAEFWIDGEKVTEATGQRPGCVVRDVMNYLCLKLDGMPSEKVEMEFVSWE